MASPWSARIARVLGVTAPAPASTRRPPGAPRRGRVRAYAAAAASRLLGPWSGTAQSANKATRYQAHVIRHRARELRENSPLIARYARLVRDNIVGPDGITLQCLLPSTRRELNTQAADDIETAWYDWAMAATPDGRPLVDALGDVAESWKIEGEGLLEVVPDFDNPCGMCVLPLDPDLLDHKLNTERTPRGSTIVQGIEYDARGRVLFFHLLTRHPSEGVSQGHRPVSPDRLLYIAERHRPQQARGVSRLASVMTTDEHLNRLAEALVVLNRVTAAKMGVLLQDETAAALEDEDGAPPEMEQAPGEWWVLPKGYKAEMLDPGQPTAEFDPFQRYLTQQIATGLGVSYEALSGNYRGATYSSARQALLVERDGWMTDQARFVGAIMVPLFREWLRWAQLRRAIALPSPHTPRTVAARSVFHPRRWPWVDPAKDADAIGKLIDLKLTTRTREANKQGLAFTDLVAELEAERRLLERAGLADAVPAAPPARPPAAPARPAPRDDDGDDDTDPDDDSEA